MSGATNGVFGRQRQHLPNRKWVTLTEAVTWLAWKDSFTETRFIQESNHYHQLCRDQENKGGAMPPESPLFKEVKGDDDGDTFLAITVKKVVRCLCDLARTETILLRGKWKDRGKQYGPRENIPADAFEPAFGFWPWPNDQRGFTESGEYPCRTFEDVYILREDVLRIKRELSPVRAGQSPGKPPQYAWEDFMARLTQYLEENGYPSPDDEAAWRNQAGVEAAMAEWCDENWTRTPAESTIRKYVSEGLQKFKQGEKADN